MKLLEKLVNKYLTKDHGDVDLYPYDEEEFWFGHECVVLGGDYYHDSMHTWLNRDYVVSEPEFLKMYKEGVVVHFHCDGGGSAFYGKQWRFNPYKIPHKWRNSILMVDNCNYYVYEYRWVWVLKFMDRAGQFAM